MHRTKLQLGRLVGLLGVGLSTACGGGDGDGDGPGGSGGGTVTDQWRSYCTATFNADTPVVDAFGDPVFTARTGSEYLIGSYEDFGGQPRVTLLYLTGSGPYPVDIESTGGAFPFTPSCDLAKATSYLGVFYDTSVFADEALTTKLCDLKAGTVLPRTSAISGYSIAGGLSFSGPATYELFLNAFSAQCGGAANGYVSVPDTEVLGTTTWLLPVESIAGPP
jgi:hypothetical protein